MAEEIYTCTHCKKDLRKTRITEFSGNAKSWEQLVYSKNEKKFYKENLIIDATDYSRYCRECEGELTDEQIEELVYLSL